MRFRLSAPALLVVLALPACRHGDHGSGANGPGASVDPCAIALAPLEGQQADPEIARLQSRARTDSDPANSLAELGQRFILQARISNDPGFYKLAEQCALCLQAKYPNDPQALLLRGHVLHQLHRFKEAEAIARDLISRRGAVLDYGLLGDSLMEQGKLLEATGAYQKMMDLKPFYQSYVRAAHVRWLKGDLKGASTLMDMAIKSASPQDPESIAWGYSRLALYRLQDGSPRQAWQFTDAALAYVKDYALALLVRGRTLLAEGKYEQAVEPLKQAASANPLPEYQWALADALEAAKRREEARRVEEELRRTGASNDPRTYALYLATRGRDPETALGLARKELEVRSDILTWDALAWSQAAAGQAKEAHETMQRALASGTEDARLFCHAAVIARKAGLDAEAQRWFKKARALRQMLLPSERRLLPGETGSGTGA